MPMPDRMNSCKVTQFLEDRSGLDRWARDIGLSDGENASQVFKKLVSQDVDVELLQLCCPLELRSHHHH